MSEHKKRAIIRLTGIIQGVGFRPFVYRLARKFSLKGIVINTSSGVSIEVEGNPDKINLFYNSLIKEAPILAFIESSEIEYQKPKGYKEFQIKKSKSEEGRYVLISPDICICKDCLKELFNKKDRRYRYPFINCTNCGPRFTIIIDTPYDRDKTTMKKFKLCPDCYKEYTTIEDRRYHAQPNSCEICGPAVYLYSRGQACLSPTKNSMGQDICPDQSDPIKETIKLLKKGEIVAIKGLGGFHLACDALNPKSVKELRKRKSRPFKPFALMAKDIETVKEFCYVNSSEKKLLSSPQRPIVLLKKKNNSLLSEEIAPNTNYLGVMLPYTPIHYLIFSDSLRLLIMTSGNMADEPLVIDVGATLVVALNNRVSTRLTPTSFCDINVTPLSKITKHYLNYNRDINSRCDDSIATVFENETIITRRARGYAPLPILFKKKFPQILACGAELKNTFCLTKDKYAFLSQYIGDLKNKQTLQFFEEEVAHFKRMFLIEPEIIVSDLHPDYLSSRFARDYAKRYRIKKILTVQHHFAHIASCMGENNIQEKVIGVSFDGIGLGNDGNIWGGEFLIADYHSFERVGHIRYAPMPGGDKASEECSRMAIAYLYDTFGDEMFNLDIDFLKQVDRKFIYSIIAMIKRRINTPLTSGCGRLFDAISSLLRICDQNTYEAQAPIELETVADNNTKSFYNFDTLNGNGYLILDTRSLIREVVGDLGLGVGRELISAMFHNGLAEAVARVCKNIRRKTALNKVVLSGGVWQNKFLLKETLRRLRAEKFDCYYHRNIPTNDGGISLGQALIANAIFR
jgi:hydrogenase maturation protein HypF